MLIDVGEQPIRDHIRFQVDSRLFEREFLHRGGIRLLGHLGVEPQIPAGADVLVKRAGPVVSSGVQMRTRNRSLREHVADRGTQTAARRVDVADIAFQAELHGKIGLGVSRISTEAQECEYAGNTELSRSTDH